jgi:TetR/AcrR family transcriptional repressor of nem operon
MPKQQTKELLISKGADLIHRKGFQDCGILEVLEATGIPKGSFYYYFKNKEDFGLQVIDLYAAVMFQSLHDSMKLPGLPIIDRIRRFFRDMSDRAAEGGYSGCPLGNLSQEMGNVNEVFRNKLEGIFMVLEKEITGHLNDARDAGEIPAHIHPEKVAVFLVSSWEGALLRMKLTRDIGPFGIFEQTAFNELLSKK